MFVFPIDAVTIYSFHLARAGSNVNECLNLFIARRAKLICKVILGAPGPMIGIMRMQSINAPAQEREAQ